MSYISSPCILVCSIDQKSGYCFGCGRTSSEIASWIDYSDTQRTEIMAMLESRLATVKRKPRRVTKRRHLKQQSATDIRGPQL